ncbi:MAG TPA: hypothetical protein VH592_22150 [Gemmataceae bacterium]|jgi:hypothetical protein
MKSKRILALIGLILVVVVGFGFAKIVLPGWLDPASALLIEEQREPVTTESGVEGHHDFRFLNQAYRPLTMRLDRTDCQCAHVQICVTPDEWKERDSQAFLNHASEAALTWQLLERGGPSFVIPARSEGLIRVVWKAIKVGASSIGIVLKVEGGGIESTQNLAALVNFVTPAFFCSADDPKVTEIDVGRMKPGDERTAHFLCYSTTRAKFTLTPVPSTDPCIAYGTPQALTPEEIQALSQKAGIADVRGGYHVKVTVREKSGDYRLDIGPFHRRIAFTTDVYPDHRVSTYVNGTVQGELSVAASDAKDSIDLGMIVPTEPRPTTFIVESRDPLIQLTVDEEKTLPFLKVELLDGKEGKTTDRGKRWQVRVEFLRDALFRGVFPDPSRAGYDSPDMSSVVFLVSRLGQPTTRERRFLVPVRGSVRSY